MIEQRLQTTSFGSEEYVHLDEAMDIENVYACEESEHEFAMQTEAENEIPEELWCTASLSRKPPDPDPEVDRIAEVLEEDRLKRMNVLRDLLEEANGLDALTTRFVHDWRIKDRTMKNGQKIRMRRARMVAREYANERRDDVHSPASGCQSHRLLPLLFLMELQESWHGRSSPRLP